MEKIYYHVLNNDPHIFDERNETLIQCLFLAGYERCEIFIDHPNHVFANKLIDVSNNTIDEIDWDNIDYSKMINVETQQKLPYMAGSDYYFKYCLDKIKNEISQLVKKGRGKEAIRYLTIVQKNYKGDYLVRGIVKGTYKEGFSIAFNKKYLDVMPYGFINDYINATTNEQEISSNTPEKKL